MTMRSWLRRRMHSGWHDNDDYSKDVAVLMVSGVVRFISDVRTNRRWMHERHLKALELLFEEASAQCQRGVPIFRC